EAQARERGLTIRVAQADAGQAVRASIHGFQGGLVKLIGDLSTERLVGATIVSPRAGEIVGELTLAIRTRVPLSLLADTIHAFATAAATRQIPIQPARLVSLGLTSRSRPSWRRKSPKRATTKPRPIRAMAVRTHASSVRSLARCSRARVLSWLAWFIAPPAPR